MTASGPCRCAVSAYRDRCFVIFITVACPVSTPSAVARVTLSTAGVSADVMAWLEQVVVGHNLCPFAGRELRAARVRIEVCLSSDLQQLVDMLQAELAWLIANDAVETSILAHPQVLQDFGDYNQFLDVADALLETMELDGIIQIASFHPAYRFDGTDDDDPANYTNRSPYPLLHLLREDSVSRAIERHGDSEAITTRNIRYLTDMGIERARKLVTQRRG